jgi:hypothetical protein
MPRLNPPPGWPPVPAGWTPPANWQPDPSWPAPPPGWQLWIEDAAPAAATGRVATAVPVATAKPALDAQTISSYWAIGGGIALIIGAWIPFITVTASTSFGAASDTFSMPTFLQLTSAIWGLILAGLGFGMRKTPGYSTALLVLAILGLIGYGAFTLFGLVGVWIFHFYPSIGLILSLLGNIAVFVGAQRSKKSFVYQRVPA